MSEIYGEIEYTATAGLTNCSSLEREAVWNSLTCMLTHQAQTPDICWTGSTGEGSSQKGCSIMDIVKLFRSVLDTGHKSWKKGLVVVLLDCGLL